jgi:hypothetical protein
MSVPEPSSRPLLTADQVRQRLGLKRVHGVLALIWSGRLKATNISPDKRRATWRIAEEDLEAFRKGQ